MTGAARCVKNAQQQEQQDQQAEDRFYGYSCANNNAMLQKGEAPLKHQALTQMRPIATMVNCLMSLYANPPSPTSRKRPLTTGLRSAVQQWPGFQDQLEDYDAAIKSIRRIAHKIPWQ